MSAPTPPLSYVNIATLLGIEEASLSELLLQKLAALRVAIPAKVVSFNSTKQTVTVQPTVRENVLINGVPTPTDLPPLQDVILATYRGGGFSVTLPIQPGDEGLVVFADMCIDAWYQSGGTANNQAKRRRHSLSDGFFFPGACSQPRKLANYAANMLQLRSDDGNVHIDLQSGQIYITPDNGNARVLIKVGQVTITPDGGTTFINIVAGEIDLQATVVRINGTDYHAHVHSGVTTGGGISGPVTP